METAITQDNNSAAPFQHAHEPAKAEGVHKKRSKHLQLIVEKELS